MRNYSFGAIVRQSGVDFSVWAPQRNQVELAIVNDKGEAQRFFSLERREDGFFFAHLGDIQPGALYMYRLDGAGQLYPDPASRFQPFGVHGPSQVIDSSAYDWKDHAWGGLPLEGQVLYELHLGTFTDEGTWAAAKEKLPYLKSVGVTAVEIMPVADFQGEFGWGYDGVYWYAPCRLYGSPDDFRDFVDAAHQIGIGVMLDVVYNHFGPTGNYWGAYSPYFPSVKHATDWGDALNYDGEHRGPVRRFVIENAAYWIREFHLDGLRFDATQTIFDDTSPHVLAETTTAAREAAGDRPIVVVAENDAQEICHVHSPDEGGYGMDGLWNDDFHHACRVAATGHREFYFADYVGTPQELVSAMRWGYLYQGQWNQRNKRKRGSAALGTPRKRFIHFLQNHDQVSNSASAMRTHALTSPGRFRALTALMLLGPQTPMLFMGQEFAASSPFYFFADHEVGIDQLARDGRLEFMRCFPRAAGYFKSHLPNDPIGREAFQRSKLKWEEVETNAQVVALHRDLLHLRKNDVTISQQDDVMLEGAVIGDEAFLLRWITPSGEDRLMLVNLGRDLPWDPVAEPLIAAPHGTQWSLLWSSEEPRYGGSGTALLDTQRWLIPGHTAVAMRPVER
ncbi:malto-oligosyltrehalose trehalohydrolase [Blastopirellula sp. JC732]|uniref:Malto-oligosyltrehalose trehalohydrolase n=1 Tax=Blastopirellula sediminis TaxID=2894196 RepID=A0A9X1MLJ2_9BACT|nr:malto-oligosyltrehalose trehalohydrolase [Blastopirellula sediminis]MCC9608676.1 malto-oligosyltrehalose trehalohydrolase [Blastopirellula sediminis]MCC9628547.1 malto-oligosyltrehalose trehalohydrolase [Blastopirellula sediminis]